MVPEACSGKEPVGSKAATGEAFTFKWGGPGGRARRARALRSLGAQPRAFVAPCSWHHGSWEGSGAGDEKVAAVSLPGFPLTQTPEVGLGAGTFADVLVCAGSASPGARRRADDYIYGISRRPRVSERFLPLREVYGDGHAASCTREGAASGRAGGRFRGGTCSLPLNLNHAGILLLRLRRRDAAEFGINESVESVI